MKDQNDKCSLPLGFQKDHQALMQPKAETLAVFLGESFAVGLEKNDHVMCS